MAVAIGLALIASALLTPYQTEGGNYYVNSPQLEFFLPVPTSLTLASFNGSVRLVVSPVDSSLNPGSPIVNITVYPKETVLFDVPARGFYQVVLVGLAASTESINLTLSQSGIPLDLLSAGSVLVAIGGLAEGYFRFKSIRRQDSSP